jgi:hypothetical protein
MGKGLTRMNEMQQQYDEVCDRAAQFKTEEAHLNHLKELQRQLQELAGGLSDEWVEQAPGEFVSKHMLRRK